MKSLLMILDIPPEPVRTTGAGVLVLLAVVVLAIVGVVIVGSVFLFIKVKRARSLTGTKRGEASDASPRRA